MEKVGPLVEAPHTTEPTNSSGIASCTSCARAGRAARSDRGLFSSVAAQIESVSAPRRAFATTSPPRATIVEFRPAPQANRVLKRGGRRASANGRR